MYHHMLRARLYTLSKIRICVALSSSKRRLSSHSTKCLRLALRRGAEYAPPFPCVPPEESSKTCACILVHPGIKPTWRTHAASPSLAASHCTAHRASPAGTADIASRSCALVSLCQPTRAGRPAVLQRRLRWRCANEHEVSAGRHLPERRE